LTGAVGVGEIRCLYLVRLPKTNPQNKKKSEVNGRKNTRNARLSDPLLPGSWASNGECACPDSEGNCQVQMCLWQAARDTRRQWLFEEEEDAHDDDDDADTCHYALGLGFVLCWQRVRGPLLWFALSTLLQNGTDRFVV
jgi:hypothetical protein